MAEDKKKKSGLHKKISSIFEGVPLPGGPPAPGGPPPASGGPPLEQAGSGPSKPLPPPFQQIRVPGVAPKGFEPMQPGPQAAPVSPPKDETVAKPTGPGLRQRIKDKLLTPRPGVSGTRQRVMLVLVPALLVVLIFVMTSVFAPSRKVTTPSQDKLPTAGIGPGIKFEWEIPPPYPTELRDPMQPTQLPTVETGTETGTEKVEAIEPEKPVVKGILYSDDKPSAIIGTRIVHEGDKVSGATVVKIDKDDVEFEKDGKKWKQSVEP